MSYGTVVYEKSDNVARITLNRPEKLNAINDALFGDLETALEEASRDWDVRVVIIKGAGRAFSVGQDLSGVGTAEVVPPDPRTRPYLRDLWWSEQRRRRRWEAIYGHAKMLLAQVHGYCLGAGCDLAMMCHSSIAAEDAIFGDPSVRMGYASANPLWTWRVGIRKARELLLTGKYIDGKEAYRIGLVTMVVPRDQLEEEVERTAQLLCRHQGIAGRDGVSIGFMELHGGSPFRRITMDLAGLAAAWGFTSNIFALSAIQRRGFRPDEFNFYEARDRMGLKGALRERDTPFEELVPTPKPS